MSLTGAETMLWSEMGRKEGGLDVHRNVPYEFAITFSGNDVVDTFLPRPLKVCDTPPMGVLNNVFTSARSLLLAKDSSSSPMSLRASRPEAR